MITTSYRLQTTLDKHYGTVNLLKTLPDDFKMQSRRRGSDPTVKGPGSFFLSAARDGVLNLWTSDGNCCASQGAHRTAVTCMSDAHSFNDVSSQMSGPCVITSGMDSIVRIWNIRRVKVVSEFNLPNVVRVAWFNQSVITGTSTGDMYIWDYYDDGRNDAESSKGWHGRELTHHSHQCSDIVTSKYCVASASKSGKILRYLAF